MIVPPARDDRTRAGRPAGARHRRTWVIVGAAMLAAAGCGGPDGSAPVPADSGLREVTLPDLSRVDPAVETQVREAHAALVRTMQDAIATDTELGTAYGRVGMLLQAAEYYESAEPAYQHAERLMPGELRWPYFLAHLYRTTGDPARAIAAFERGLELRPDDVPTLVWLGRTHLDQGALDRAEPMLERARQLAPTLPAALAGLGQVALARRDFSRAVSLFEEALAIDPSARSIHSPLAQAYRGLGDLEAAEAHVAEWENTEVLVPDPLRLELDLALESGLSYELRGVRALEQKDFDAAAGFFRQGVDLTDGTTPLGRSLRHKLATALYLNGDLQEAVTWFEETVRLAPADVQDESTAKAHYSLGVLQASRGRGAQAIAHLSSAVRFSPTYVEGHLALADALRRAGRLEAAMAEYTRVLELNPQSADARFGYGMALVRLARHREARDWFEDAAARHPDRLDLPHALARVLAAAPDADVRDPGRAYTIVQRLLRAQKTTDLGETLAMALAGGGRFEEAASVQRDVIAAARRAGAARAVEVMSANLARYEAGEPCRVPWPADDPVHAPGPPVDPALQSLRLATAP